jgi:hypothetical protein
MDRKNNIKFKFVNVKIKVEILEQKKNKLKKN